MTEFGCTLTGTDEQMVATESGTQQSWVDEEVVGAVGADRRRESETMTKNVRKFFILLLGLSILLVGTLMIVLPGPAFIVIPAGLAILATEFIWAQKILQKIKESARQVSKHLKKNKLSSPP